ncbi:MAG: hypothetical protein IPM46_12055 [Flavobacteriales bacterium]|nr:hypothetical protein [Flavobacteriales bacterium]
MDNATLTIGIICLALFALPFVLDYRSRRKKAARLQSAMRDAAQQQRSTIGQVDTCNGIALGMDEDKKTLFFYNEREENPAVQHVNLAEVRSCEALRDGRTAKADDAEGMPASVELCLVPKENSRDEKRLVLYRSGYGTTLDGEVQFADNWARLINGWLKSK